MPMQSFSFDCLCPGHEQILVFDSVASCSSEDSICAQAGSSRLDPTVCGRFVPFHLLDAAGGTKDLYLVSQLRSPVLFEYVSLLVSTRLPGGPRPTSRSGIASPSPLCSPALRSRLAVRTIP
ncbi:Neurofibromin [Manis pentadactyla]|nr:Neurofibromin [Manis pentadactyla]